MALLDLWNKLVAPAANQGLSDLGQGISNVSKAVATPVLGAENFIEGGLTGNFDNTWGQRQFNNMFQGVNSANQSVPTQIPAGTKSYIPSQNNNFALTSGGIVNSKGQAPVPHSAAPSFIGPMEPNGFQVQTASQGGQLANLSGGLNTGSGVINGDSQVDSTGKSFNFGGTSQITSPPQDFSASIPSGTTPSSSLGTSPTNADINSALSKNNSLADNIFSNLGQMTSNVGQAYGNLTSASTIPQSELDLQSKVASDQAAMTGLGYQSQGLYNPGNQNIALPFLTGQAQSKMVSAGLQTTIDQAALAYAQGNRQFAFNAASTIYNAARQNLQDMLNVYTQTAPQNIATNYNPTTGALNAVMRNPLTGEQYTANLGNIGAQKTFVQISSPVLDPNSGQYFVTAFKSDGTSEIIPITGQNAGQSSTNAQSTGQMGNFNLSPTGLTTPAAIHNNPGNLRNPDGSWQTFSTPQQGFQALMQDIYGKQTGNTHTGLNGNSTLSQFTSVYAPASDGNDPVGYANTIAKQLGVTPQTPIGQIPTTKLAAAVAQHEDGRYWQAITSGTGTSGSAQLNVAPVVQKYVETLPNANNSEYVNSNRVPQNLQDPIKAMAGGVVPVLTDSEVNTVKSISTTAENLEQMRTIAQNILGSGGLGAFGSSISNFFQSKIPQLTGQDVGKFQTFSDAAIKTIQGLASGGSGLRINQAEIDNAVNNMPTLYDNQATAMAKLNQVESFLQNSLAQILPHAQLNVGSGSTGGTDYASILNQLVAQ